VSVPPPASREEIARKKKLTHNQRIVKLAKKNAEWKDIAKSKR